MAAKLPVALSALCLWGCVVTPEAKGPTQYESRAVDRDASERVRVNLDMGAGDLKEQRYAEAAPGIFHLQRARS